MEQETYFIGVDVGTGSVRAALVNAEGKVVKIEIKPIKTWNPKQDFYEQSSDEIWNACAHCVKNLVKGLAKENVKGIGFDATCSLVAVDADGKPVSLSPTGNDEQNVILWMDHRAKNEAKIINDSQNRVLKYIGGKISLEMQTPKLMWLKNHLNHSWKRADSFFDLPDFLTWKATGEKTRSSCSLVCKWTYEIGDNVNGWNRDYLCSIGLEDLIEQNFRKIGNEVLAPGTPIGNGICEVAALELDLLPGTPVGTSLIDAHAGGLGMIGCFSPEISSNFNTRLSLICGTSTCHMVVSQLPIFTAGVWGPYYNAMVPGMWLNEGGQSATGKLIDFIVDTHPATKKIKSNLKNKHIQAYLGEILMQLKTKRNLESMAYLTQDVHIWPDFHGNRSPIADPTLKGMICGLTLNDDEENLAILYLATIQALSYGTRHIIETMQRSGYNDLKTILICGGLSKNPLFIQTQADVVSLPVLCPKESESVLVGSAILGACAANYFPNINEAIKSMGGNGVLVKPNEKEKTYHDKKYKIYLKMYEHQMIYKNIMQGN